MKQTPENNCGKIYLWWNLLVTPKTPRVNFYEIPHKYVQHCPQH